MNPSRRSSADPSKRPARLRRLPVGHGQDLVDRIGLLGHRAHRLIPRCSESSPGPPTGQRPPAGRGVVGPLDRVGRIAPGGDPRVPQQLPDQPGVAHRPARPGLELGRAGPVLEFDQRAPAASTVARWARSATSTSAKARPSPSSTSRSHGEREHPAGPAAAPAVVPEPGPQPRRQAGGGDRVPAPVDQRSPAIAAACALRTARPVRELREEPEDLGVARRAVAPAVGVPLEAEGDLLRVGVRDQEAVRPGLVAGDHVGDRRPARRRPGRGGRPPFRSPRARRRCPACRARCGAVARAARAAAPRSPRRRSARPSAGTGRPPPPPVRCRPAAARPARCRRCRTSARRRRPSARRRTPRARPPARVSPPPARSRQRRRRRRGRPGARPPRGARAPSRRGRSTAPDSARCRRCPPPRPASGFRAARARAQRPPPKCASASSRARTMPALAVIQPGVRLVRAGLALHHTPSPSATADGLNPVERGERELLAGRGRRHARQPTQGGRSGPESRPPTPPPARPAAPRSAPLRRNSCLG